jgi:hypothetical protein
MGSVLIYLDGLNYHGFSLVRMFAHVGCVQCVNTHKGIHMLI